MAGFLTKDKVRDTEKITLDFNETELGVQQKTGQITTFDQLDIIGINDKPDGRCLPKNKNKEGFEKNVIVFGAAGCGKTRGYVIPNVLEDIEEKDNIVVHDPKEEIYDKTHEAAEANGYNVKVVNFENRENSSRIDLFKRLKRRRDGGNIYEAAHEMAYTAIKNIVKEETAFFVSTATLLLETVILYVATSKKFNEREHSRDFVAVYETIKQIAKDRQYLNFIDFDDLAYDGWSAFKDYTENIQDSACATLLEGMNVMQDEKVQRMFSCESPDFYQPSDSPFICYIQGNGRRSGKDYSFITDLLFDDVYDAIYIFNYQNINPKKNIHVYLDEFDMLGDGLNIIRPIVSFRKCKANTSIILKNKSQLKNKYPDDWETIMSICKIIKM